MKGTNVKEKLKQGSVIYRNVETMKDMAYYRTKKMDQMAINGFECNKE